MSKTPKLVDPANEILADKIQLRSVNTTTPKVCIVGCGGAGINLARELRNIGADVYVIDTSKANDVPADIFFDLIESYDSTIEGAGKIRRELAAKIQADFAKLKAMNQVYDVTIILHSFSGGSGSVIGPLCAKHIGLKKEPFVVVGMVDIASKIDVENSVLTMHTYQAIADSEEMYIPLRLVSNQKGRKTVDHEIKTFVTNLIDMLTNTETRELDISDKKNFLRPYLIESDLVGVYDIDVYTDADVITDKSPTHSTMLINSTGDLDGVAIPETSVLFSGVSSSKWYMSTVGKPISSDLIKDLEKQVEHFAGMSTAKSKLNTLGGNKVKKTLDKSGLVL